MSTYDWKSPMRRLDEHDARRVDRLAGQVGATVHPDGRITLTVMPDANCFSSAATISAEDARALAETILNGPTSTPRVHAACGQPMTEGRFDHLAWPSNHRSQWIWQCIPCGTWEPHERWLDEPPVGWDGTQWGSPR